MDALEALSILHAERGYLILGTQYSRAIGEVVTDSVSAWHQTESGETRHEYINQPVVVIEEATREDFIDQDLHLRTILGKLPQGDTACRFFYKVTAKD